MHVPDQAPTSERRASLTSWYATRVCLYVACLWLVAASLLCIWASRTERAQVVERTQQSVMLIRPELQQAAKSGDTEGARRLVASLLTGVTTQAQIRLADGRILAATDGASPGGMLSRALYGDLEQQEIRLAHGENAPSLLLTLDPGLVWARTQALLFWPLVIASLLALIAAWSLIMTVRNRLVQPLQQLEREMRQVDPDSSTPLRLSVLDPHQTNEIGRLAECFSDRIGEIARSHADLTRMVRIDHLTGLCNRIWMGEALQRAVEQARANDSQLALLYLDLDRFKHINDSLGHAAGDKLLQVVARRLTELVADRQMVARMGGDEFLILLERVDDRSRVIRLAEDILRGLTQPFPVSGHSVHVGTSIGISMWPRDGSDAEQLIRSADTAMYAAKAAGAGTWRFFSREMRERSLVWLRTEASLREALEQNQLEVFYQPKVTARDRVLHGMEALLRWRPADCYVSPTEFIPIAEDTGLIIPIGAWVLRTACQQAVRWSRLHGPLEVAVNVSARQLASADFPATVRECLETSGLPPEQLTLEITESMLMDNLDAAMEVLHGLRILGVGIAVDDFGTGYSSLAYLRQLPITQLKIDRTFVKDLPADTAIAETVLTLARRLSLQCVAEGVETAAQLSWLAAADCDLIQGFHIAAALPAREFEQQFLAQPRLRLVNLRELGSEGGAA